MSRADAGIPPPFQVAFIVDDVDAAIRYWTRVVGAGPFFTFPAREWDELYYYGEPTRVDARMAIGQWGNTQIEFITQVNDARSPYKTFADAGRKGMHHFGSMVDDLDSSVARLERAGKQRAFWGVAKGGIRFAYLVEDEHPGSVLELIERGPAIEAMMKMVADAARHWDGTDPIRALG